MRVHVVEQTQLERLVRFRETAEAYETLSVMEENSNSPGLIEGLTLRQHASRQQVYTNNAHTEAVAMDRTARSNSLYFP